LTFERDARPCASCLKVNRTRAVRDTFTPSGSDAECGYACHTRVAAKDYIYTAYPKEVNGGLLDECRLLALSGTSSFEWCGTDSKATVQAHDPCPHRGVLISGRARLARGGAVIRACPVPSDGEGRADQERQSRVWSNKLVPSFIFSLLHM
jgi:hypothetical protein